MPVQTTYPTDLDQGVEGQLFSTAPAQVDPAFNGDVVDILPGRAVIYGSATDGRNVKLPSTSADVVCGVALFSQVYENGVNGEIESTGYKPGAQINLLRRGRMLGVCEDGCAPGARLWVRYTSAGGSYGKLRASDAGGSTCLDCTTKGEWRTYALAAGFAEIDVNFANK